MSLATHASAACWGGSVLSPVVQEVSDNWVGEELSWDISTKEAVSIDHILLSCLDLLSNAWVDVLVDNQAVIHSWNNQGRRSASLNHAIKQLFFTTLKLNISLHLSYVPTGENPADVPSRQLSAMDSRLTDSLWVVVQKEFGGDGHTCDMMALDSNAMLNCFGNRLPYFTPHQTPESAGVNVFAQDLASHLLIMQRPYVFPPLVLVGPLLRFLQYYQQSCTLGSTGGLYFSLVPVRLETWPPLEIVMLCSFLQNMDGLLIRDSRVICGRLPSYFNVIVYCLIESLLTSFL